VSGALSTNGCSSTKFARRSRKEEKRPQWWGYNERSRRGWCSTTPPKPYERRNACHPQRLKISRSAGGAAADYAHVHKLLVSLPPDPPPSFPAAILELKLAHFLSEQWGPPCTAFMYAAQYNQNQDMISVFLKAGAAINAQDKDGVTALMYAAFANQNPEVISVLLRAGADIKSRNKHGGTPLMYAADANQKPGIISILVEAGADVNARDKDGGTVLMHAAGYNQNVEVIYIFLKAGGDINAQDKDGVTPLMYAAGLNKNSQLILELLKAGADARAKDSKGKTAFDYVKDNDKLKGTDAYNELYNAAYAR